MSRVKNRRTPKPSIPNPVPVIDITQDSPSNASYLRLSRVQRAQTEESDTDSYDNEIVIPLDDSTEDSNGDIKDLSLQRPNKTAIVINLDDTIYIDENPNKSRANELVINESQIKKGNLSCPICFESLADDEITPMSTPCGHVYCLGCLKKMAQTKKKCALCQRSISLSKCIRLHI